MIENWGEIFASIIGTGFLAGLGALLIILIAGFYIYTALAWMQIAQRMKHKYPWLAFIPIANIAMILQLGKFHWALIFLALIPVAGWLALFVLIIVATWRIFEKQNYPGWFSLSMIIPQIGGILYLIAIGFVAWKPRKKRMKL